MFYNDLAPGKIPGLSLALVACMKWYWDKKCLTKYQKKNGLLMAYFGVISRLYSERFVARVNGITGGGDHSGVSSRCWPQDHNRDSYVS